MFSAHPLIYLRMSGADNVFCAALLMCVARAQIMYSSPPNDLGLAAADNVFCGPPPLKMCVARAQIMFSASPLIFFAYVGRR